MAERKDRLVQTRVPERLEATLKEEANKNGTTVSQLIRGVLEDAFDLVDGVAGNIDQIVSESVELAQRLSGSGPPHPRSARRRRQRASVCGEPRRGAEKRLATVSAWNEVFLNKKVNCSRCGTELGKGTRALSGLHDKPGKPREWLCLGALDLLNQG
jgi:hypothetical protein